MVGPGFPGPVALPRPDRQQGGSQAFVSLSLVVPGALNVFHIGLLSAPVVETGADFFILGFPP